MGVWLLLAGHCRSLLSVPGCCRVDPGIYCGISVYKSSLWPFCGFRSCCRNPAAFPHRFSVALDHLCRESSALACRHLLLASELSRRFSTSEISLGIVPSILTSLIASLSHSVISVANHQYQRVDFSLFGPFWPSELSRRFSIYLGIVPWLFHAGVTLNCLRVCNPQLLSSSQCSEI